MKIVGIFIGITLVIVIVLGIINGHQDAIREENKLIEQQKQQKLDQNYSDCLDYAKRDYIEAEINYCEHSGGSENTCIYNTPQINGGYIYQNYQSDKDNCIKQYPGGVYKK